MIGQLIVSSLVEALCVILFISFIRIGWINLSFLGLGIASFLICLFVISLAVMWGSCRSVE